MTTDAHVIAPLFFPGGDIGSLAVHGTINDVAMAGARPLYLSAAFVLEEGFPLGDLDRIVASMARASREAGAPVITGDTKVVEKGKGDGVFITTTGIGVVPQGVHISGDRATPGDAILVSGTLGDHGIAVLSKRENLSSKPRSCRTAPPFTASSRTWWRRCPAFIACAIPHAAGWLRRSTKSRSNRAWASRLAESAIPFKADVLAACELLGLDPLYIANEGKLIAICEKGDAGRLLSAMRAHPLGRDAAIIGEVVADAHAFVQMQTRFGGNRMVDWLLGDPLPRIC